MWLAVLTVIWNPAKIVDVWGNMPLLSYIYTTKAWSQYTYHRISLFTSSNFEDTMFFVTPIVLLCEIYHRIKQMYHLSKL